MTAKIGISGFGRISRVVIRAAVGDPDVEICGINKRNADIDYLLYLLKYDTTFGRFPKPLDRYEDGLIIDGKKVPVFSENDITKIPWASCGAEYVVEGTGAYTTTEKASGHLVGGAKKVIITAPAKDTETPTFVMGVNEKEYKPEYKVVSNASCTTNCLAPLVKVVNDKWGIDKGMMSTIHAATAKQKTVDSSSPKDWRRGRAVFGNIIPTTTGAAKAVGLVIPDLKGKMTGIAYRVPTADVSIVDVNVSLKKPATYEDICKEMKRASEEEMKGILEYVDDEVVTGDFVGDPCTSIFDAREGISIDDTFFKLISYYDNEYGYSSKIVDLAKYMDKVDHA